MSFVWSEKIPKTRTPFCPPGILELICYVCNKSWSSGKIRMTQNRAITKAAKDGWHIFLCTPYHWGSRCDECHCKYKTPCLRETW